MTPYHIDTATHLGVTVQIGYCDDSPHDPPWEDSDGHGPVRQARGNRFNCPKRPGEVVLHVNHPDRWLYDVQAATVKALAEGWGCSKVDTTGMTRRQVAAAAVQEDMKYLRDWLQGGWSYVGIVCKVFDKDGEVEAEESCWGYETLDDYHKVVGKEMAESLAEQVVADRAAKLAAEEREAAEVAYWLDRGVVTGRLYVEESF